MFYLCTDIRWDIDQDNDKHRNMLNKLPKQVVVEVEGHEFLCDEAISDVISDRFAEHFGLCHNGFRFEPIDVLQPM